MMSILEYAEDVNLSVEEILKLCDKLGIKYENENTMLDEDSIVLLDGETANITEDEELADELIEEEVLEERVEKIISDATRTC